MAIGPEDLGHILVFLTGRAECEAACSLAMNRLEEIVKSQREVGDAVIMPLYGTVDQLLSNKVSIFAIYLFHTK